MRVLIKPLSEIMKYYIRGNMVYDNEKSIGPGFNLKGMEVLCGKWVEITHSVDEMYYTRDYGSWYLSKWMIETESDAMKRILESYEI